MQFITRSPPSPPEHNYACEEEVEAQTATKPQRRRANQSLSGSSRAAPPCVAVARCRKLACEFTEGMTAKNMREPAAEIEQEIRSPDP